MEPPDAPRAFENNVEKVKARNCSILARGDTKLSRRLDPIRRIGKCSVCDARNMNGYNSTKSRFFLRVAKHRPSACISETKESRPWIVGRILQSNSDQSVTPITLTTLRLLITLWNIQCLFYV